MHDDFTERVLPLIQVKTNKKWSSHLLISPILLGIFIRLTLFKIVVDFHLRVDNQEISHADVSSNTKTLHLSAPYSKPNEGLQEKKKKRF